jgi:hypothetical protein
MRVLGPAKYFSDFSSIRRMRDAYPLALFTIENALRLSQDSSVDSFICLVIYSLWQSALLKKSFSKGMRRDKSSRSRVLFDLGGLLPHLITAPE